MRRRALRSDVAQCAQAVSAAQAGGEDMTLDMYWRERAGVLTQ
jgi:hypothetical protein